jgi:hypothetical protein
VIANTFSRLELIPFWETIYSSSFFEGTPNVHFLGFSFILNVLRLSKVSARSEMSPLSSRVFNDHVVNVRFGVAPELSM